MSAMPRTWVERDNMLSRLDIERPARRRIGKFASQHENGRERFHLKVSSVGFKPAEMAVAAFSLQQQHMERSFGVVLTRVSLVKCSITASSVPYLLSGMRECDSVVEWDLSCNSMGAVGVRDICAVVASKPQITSLNIAATRLLDIGRAAESDDLGATAGSAAVDASIPWLPDGVAGVVALLQSAHSLTTLDISRNMLGVVGMEMLSSGIASAVAVKTLLLCGNEIAVRSAMLLVKGVAANRTLTTLDMSANKLGGAGVAAFAVVARRNRVLRHLVLHGSRIDDLSCDHFLVAVRASFITRLDLSGNALGSVGASLVGKQLLGSHLSSLREVDLTHCCLTNDGTDLAGIRALAAGIAGNRTVLKYVLVNNKIVPRDFTVRDTRKADMSAVEAFAEAIRANRVFVVLDLRDNGMHEYRPRKQLLHALAESQTGIPDALLVKDALEAALLAAEKTQALSYPRISARWLRVRVVQAVLDFIAEPRQILTK